MGDFLSFLYTVVDSLSLILFLDSESSADLLSPQSGHKNRDDSFILYLQRTGVVRQNFQ